MKEVGRRWMDEKKKRVSIMMNTSLEMGNEGNRVLERVLRVCEQAYEDRMSKRQG